MEEVRKLKMLNTKKKLLAQNMEKLQLEIRRLRVQLADYSQQMREMNEEIDKLTGKPGIKVSEHCLLRYLERVKGIDIHELEREILCEQVLGLVESLGVNGTFPAAGFSVVLKNGTAITIKT